MSGKKKSAAKEDPNSRPICKNRKARFNYEILDELDCGVVLVGSEVKSIRQGKISLEEAYARMRDGELWLINANIAEYPQASVMNHEPTRPRKLLVHKRELRKFAERAEERGFTLVPLEVYLENGIIKVKIGLARGRKQYDKRDRIQRDTDRKDMRQALLKRK